MRVFRVALAQINPTVGDLDRNTRLVLDGIERARGADADLVAFPELCLTGYPPEDLIYKDSFLQAVELKLEEIVRASSGLTVVVGFPERGGKPAVVYNAAAVIHDGSLVDVYRKIFLPNYSVFDEERYFESGDRCPVYRIGGAMIGVNICEDIWKDTGPTTVQSAAGAEVIVNINGSPYYRGKRAVRHRVLSDRAVADGLFVCYANMTGGQDELVFDGASMILSPRGELVAEARQFDDDFLVADLDLDVATATPQRPREEGDPRDVARWARPDVREVTETGAAARDHNPLSQRPAPAVLHPVEEVDRALVMGTRDYIHKNGFKQVVVGVSGGIDSALTAAIAADAVGAENVLGVAMPSRFTLDRSVEDARLLAENLGIAFDVLPIEGIVTEYSTVLGPLFAGTDTGVAEENIQARVRGNLLMAISNKFGRIVLATGNKSEYATGYATLYGDMAGGFAIIKDVPKTLVYQLCAWRNERAGRDVIPQAIIDRPPTAELRADQLDQDSLPPYDLLDPVLEAYVERDASPAEMIADGYPENVVRQVVALVDRSEYKRRQSAPGIKITERAFGKDRRLPIVNHYRPG